VRRRKEEGKKKGLVGPNGKNSHGPHGLCEKRREKLAACKRKILWAEIKQGNRARFKERFCLYYSFFRA
jgi:hypothetical protein